MNESVLTGSFMEPPSSKGLKGFHLGKRKRKIVDFLNGSSISVSSPLSESSVFSSSLLEMSVSGQMIADVAPEVKRKRSLSRMTSAISTPMAKMSSVLQRSLSSARLHGCPSPQKGTPTRFLRSATSVTQVCDQSMLSSQSGCDSPALKRGTSARNSASKLTPYKPPQPTPNKQRPTRFWSEKYPETVKQLPPQEVKLQEAIYELTCGEEDLVKDLLMIQKNYADPLLQLHILTVAETEMVFGKLRPIVPVHSDLHTSLIRLRCQDGKSGPIGQILFKWVEKLQEPYVEYCSSLIRTKAFLDHRRETDKYFSDFLQRCLESGFSRKLDLWSYLDVPRSKLVKYPLLLRQVVKFSVCQAGSADVHLLSLAIQKLEAALHRVDSSMAEAKCQFTISRLEWLDDAVEVRCHAVRKAREEILDGTLRNNRGTKLECHLLDTVLILGRPSSRLSSLATVPSTSSLMSTSSSTSSLLSTSSAASYHQQHVANQQQSGNHANHNSHSPTSTNSSSDFSVPCGKRLQVYRTPIPVEDMILEDLNPPNGPSSSFSDSTTSVASMSSSGNGGAKHGSFRSAFSSSSNTGNRNAFKVSFRQSSDGQAHTLFAPDEHSKRQWMAAIKKTIQNHNQQGHLLHAGDSAFSRNVFSGCLSNSNNFEGSIIIENGPFRTETSSVSETDFAVHCIIDSPSKSKRIYAQDGKVSKSQLTPIKTGLFQKNKRSPRFKTALSQTALDSVKSGGAAKKIRTTSSARRLHDENFLARISSSTSTLSSVDPSSLVVLSSLATNNRLKRRSTPALDVHMQQPQPDVNVGRNSVGSVSAKPVEVSIMRRQATSSGSLAAAAVGKRIVKQQLKSHTVSTAGESKSRGAFRSRTKSFGHLTQTGNASYHGGDVYDVDGNLKRYNTRSRSKQISKSMSDLLEL